jgi:tetratricopeptide (TPR) repeat protein
LSPLIATDAGFEAFYDRRYPEARAALEEAIKTYPKSGLPHYWLARTLQAQGHYDQAIAEFQLPATEFDKSASAMGGLGNLYGTIGRRAEALAMLKKLEAIPQPRWYTAYQRALVYVSLGDREQAVAWLQHGYDDRITPIVWLLKDPRWDPIRGDAGFQALVTRVGFPADARARAPRPATKP